MPSKFELTQVTEKDLSKLKNLPASKVVESKFPKPTNSAAEGRAALKNWMENLPEPKPPKNPLIEVRAVEPTVTAISKLAAVVNSETAPAEMLSLKFDDKTFVGTIYSAVVTHQFMLMQSEFRTRKESEKTKGGADAKWREVTGAFEKAFSLAGMEGVNGDKLAQHAKRLAGSKENLDAVTKIVNSATPTQGPGAGNAPTTVNATFVPAMTKIVTLVPITNIIPNLCSSPLTQGTFTKHYGHSFSLTVSLYVPCPTWTNPFKWCWKNFTIASVSFSLDINVGYKVNCCGAAAWGQAAAQACASIIGISVCASCTGTIVAVAGVSKSSAAGGKCTYGLGINASLQCSFQGHTVFSASAPFGYTIMGPCPPPGLKC